MSFALFICLLFFLYLVESSSPDVFNIQGSTGSSSKKSLTTRDIKRFTRYSLSFQSYRNEDIDSSTGGISFCPIEQQNNSTSIVLEHMLDRCANRKYYPRHLSPKQVSWKKTSKSAKSENKTQDASTEDKEDHENSGDDIVSEFLAFTLLLPDHPFSSDLYYAIAAVAPMFPRVTFVLGVHLCVFNVMSISVFLYLLNCCNIGNAHEFSELCTQYGVRSFPKLLFFHKGILRGKHTKNHEAGDLAAEISKWTKLLPRAFPVTRFSLMFSFL